MSAKSEDRLTQESLLSAVLYRNEAVRVENVDKGKILRVPIRRRWYMRAPLSWVMPFRKERGFSLDRLGSEVWEACDGHHTVENVVEQFAEKHRISFHEARLAVMQFVRELVRRKLVAAALPDSEESV